MNKIDDNYQEIEIIVIITRILDSARSIFINIYVQYFFL